MSAIEILSYSHDERVVIKMTLTLVSSIPPPGSLPVMSIASSPFPRYIMERIVLILVAIFLIAFPYSSESQVDR